MNRNDQEFEHLVLFMIENRSLDNVFGYLDEEDRPRHSNGANRPSMASSSIASRPSATSRHLAVGTETDRVPQPIHGNARAP